MKKLLGVVLVSITLIGSVASATALSGVTPNVIAVNPNSTVNITAAVDSAWDITLAHDVYVNPWTSAIPHALYPLLTSANVYDFTMSKTKKIVVLAKSTTCNLTFVPDSTAFVAQ